MESGERLASPAPTQSAARTSSPAASSSSSCSSSSSSSSPAPNSKSSLAQSPSALGSTLSTSGRMFGPVGEQPFIGSTLSSAFPLVNHPAFGALYAAGAGRPEFGGLGSLGVPAALAAHPQLGALSEWWRAAEAHGRGSAAFIPSFISFPPFFTPHIQPNHSTTPVQMRVASKNSHSPSKGVNGAVNGSGVCLPTTQLGSVSAMPASVQASSKPTKNLDISQSQCSSPQNSAAEAVIKLPQKPEDKKSRKKPVDASVVNNSESGTSSDSSSDGSVSSEEDYEDEDDDDEDDDEEDKLSELSDSEKLAKKRVKVLIPSTGTAKTDRPLSGVPIAEPQDRKDIKPHKSPSNPPTLVPLPCSLSPPVLTQTMPLPLHSSMTRTERPQQHFSVIQSTGLAANPKPLALLTQPRRESSPSSLPLALNTSPKAPSSTVSPKPPKLLPSSSPQHLPLSLCSSPKPLSVPSTLPPSTSPKPFGLTSSVTSSQKPSVKHPPHSAVKSKRKLLEASLAQINEFRLKQITQGQAFPADLKKQQQGPNKSPKKTSLSSLPLPPTLPPPPQNNHSNLFLSSALLGLPEPHHPNGVIQNTTQDAPLALITKPRKDCQGKSPQSDCDAGSMPVNLCTGATRSQTTAQVGPPSQPPTTSPHATGHGSRKSKTPKVKGQTPSLVQGQGQGQANPLADWKGFSQNHLVQSLVDLFRGGESGIGIPGVSIPGVGIPEVGIPGTCNPTAGLPANKESDDSVDDDEEEEDNELEEDDDEEESDDSLSESDSNSDSDISGKKVKDLKLLPSGLSSKKEMTPRRLTKGPELLKTSTNHTATSCSPLNLQVIKTPTSDTSSSALAYPGSSSYSLATPLGFEKRKRVTDEKDLRIPLELGWRRETRIKTLAERPQGDVAYYAPCGKKLRQYPDVVKYLSRNGISGITRDNFSFSAKIRVGDFYEAREGPQGLQWSLLKEEEVIPRILAMEGRRGRPPNSERSLGTEGAKGTRRRKGRPPNVGDPLVPEGPSPSEVKLLRKLEAQEIARQAAQMKLMRKLEKQALARAAKEARKQQAIRAAEERRKQKEQIKILKQQEKIKRIQQIRMEKELKAQQILEAKRRKKEEAANAKILEAEKRIKEKELRRQQAEILKHQERERRRQHVMLMKAVEARKKAEERERLRQEKRDEKRLNKERKLEQRRLELEIARELKKPNEDMCLSDHKSLPEFSRIPGLILPGRAVADCLMLMQFLRGFGKVLGLDLNADIPTLGMLQEGLLNVGDSMGHVQDLLVKLLSLAVCDPGLPPGQKTKTMLGDHLTNVGINRDNVSEVLQMYMTAHCANTELDPLALSLKTKAFQAHTPEQKASILGFLGNELSCSKAVISEIDKSLDQMANMRKDKIILEGKLKKLRAVYAKLTGKREASVGVDENQSVGTPSSGLKRKRKLGGDSEDDDDEDEYSEDQAEDEDDDEEDEIKKAKKIETCDEDDMEQTTTVEEVEKQIEKLTKQHHQIRRKLFEISHSLHSMMYGQDRYRRRYWVLPHCGGVFIEAMQSGEAPEDLEEERRKRKRQAEEVSVKEEPQEMEVDEAESTSHDGPCIYTQGLGQKKEEKKEHDGMKNSPTLFYQQAGCVSKLCTLENVSKDIVEAMEIDCSHPPKNRSPVGTAIAKSTVMSSSPPHNTSEPAVATTPSMMTTNVPPPASCLSSVPCLPVPHESPENTPPASSPAPSPHLPFQASDQLLRVLTERSGHWFSLLPRSPCDLSSLTTIPPGAPRMSPHISTPAKPRSPPPSPALPLTPSAASASASPHHPAGLLTYPLSALQVKSGGSLLGVSFGGWTSGVISPSLPLCSSPSPMAGQTLESNTAASVSSKSESPLPRIEKPSSMPSPAVEIPKSLDYPTPRPIPEEMLTGWWRVSDIEELRALVNALHTRGIREKSLQRQIQKYMDIIPQVCTKHKDVAMIELCELEESQVSVESVRGWCVEEQAMEMDIAMLQQVEELERKVTAASLQVKGWTYPDPQSEREDLVYYEHKPLTLSGPVSAHTGDKDSKDYHEDRLEKGGMMRHPDNPLDIAVTRLADLERNIERRYLRSPLGTTIQIRLDNVGTVTVPAPAPSTSADREGCEEEVAHGMKVWRKALSEVRSAAQLAMCIQQLQKSIAWERSIMKVYCQMCKKGDNEDLLLLCDGCDKGCHTYCHKPKITSIPEGDWYCPACITKASGPSPKNKRPPSKLVASSGGGSKKCGEAKKNGKQAGNGEVSEEDSASANSTPKKGAKDTSRKKKTEEGSLTLQSTNQESPVCIKRAKTARDNNRDLGLCRVLLAELERHQDAWPFLTPVNLKSVPGYRKVIKKPMDFSTIREKLVSSQYQNLETFIIDVNLVFDNCEKFNEDNSDIGRAGHNMRKFFEKRWTELLKQTN
ncbi:bromodomain adjacent to zinc finger domain protein 2B isoform X3 [Thalassophryne amazonica]|uniref:bromodomain adjacent to zinc finger domain protein 2B isoform X3 n=1 Tax=Thalassophryne amazonica TaxID=390379 RepID=UPI001470F733|nr:bromodomain adjacent to zinc finger domain protein 2B isoform X3 [Thalassophryne amazonica]